MHKSTLHKSWLQYKQNVQLNTKQFVGTSNFRLKIRLEVAVWPICTRAAEMHCKFVYFVLQMSKYDSTTKIINQIGNTPCQTQILGENGLLAERRPILCKQCRNVAKNGPRHGPIVGNQLLRTQILKSKLNFIPQVKYGFFFTCKWKNGQKYLKTRLCWQQKPNED